MPIFDEDSIKDQQHEIKRPVEIVNPAAYKTNVIDTANTPMADVTVFIEGSLWRVDYYSQVLGTDDAVAPQAASSVNTAQQYMCIKNMELKVSSPLSQQQNKDNNQMSLQGSGYTYPRFIPNAGDVFIADVGNGRLALFQVSESTRKSVFADSVYEIEYSAIDYDDGIRMADLQAKTIDVRYYVRDFLEVGQNPILTATAFGNVDSIERWLNQSQRAYIRRFGSEEYHVLLLPELETTIYDHWLTQFVLKLIDSHEHPQYSKMRVLNCDDNRDMQRQTVLDAILETEPLTLEYAIERIGRAYSRSFTTSYVYGGVAHSGVEELLFPVNAVNPKQHGKSLGRLNALALVASGTFYTGNKTVALPNEQSDTLPYIKAVDVDDYYILSQAFYSQDTDNQSVLEQQLWSYLKQDIISFDDLKAMLDDSRQWRNMERFYYLPLLWVLCIYYLRKI